MGSAGNRTSNSIERRERERESSLENTLPLSADAVKTWPTSLSRWLAGSECILELENKKSWLAKLSRKVLLVLDYDTLSPSYCKPLYEIFRKQHFFTFNGPFNGIDVRLKLIRIARVAIHKIDSSYRDTIDTKNLAEILIFFPRTSGKQERVLKNVGSFRLRSTWTLMSSLQGGGTPLFPWREENRRRKSDTRGEENSSRFVVEKGSVSVCNYSSWIPYAPRLRGIDPCARFRAGDRASTDEKQRRRGEGGERERQLSL